MLPSTTTTHSYTHYFLSRLLYFLTSAPLLITYIYSYWSWIDTTTMIGISSSARQLFFWAACINCTILPLLAAFLLKQLKFIQHFFSQKPADSIPLILVMSLFLFWHYYVLSHTLTLTPPLLLEVAFSYLVSSCLAIPISKIKPIDSRLLAMLSLLFTLLFHIGNSTLPIPLLTYTLLIVGALASWTIYRHPQDPQAIPRCCQLAAIATFITQILR